MAVPSAAEAGGLFSLFLMALEFLFLVEANDLFMDLLDLSSKMFLTELQNNQTKTARSRYVELMGEKMILRMKIFGTHHF